MIFDEVVGSAEELAGGFEVLVLRDPEVTEVIISRGGAFRLFFGGLFDGLPVAGFGFGGAVRFGGGGGPDVVKSGVEKLGVLFFGQGFGLGEGVEGSSRIALFGENTGLQVKKLCGVRIEENAAFDEGQGLGGAFGGEEFGGGGGVVAGVAAFEPEQFRAVSQGLRRIGFFVERYKGLVRNGIAGVNAGE